MYVVSWWRRCHTISKLTIMSTSHQIPQNLLEHPGFLMILRADSSGTYERNKEQIYDVILQMCGTQARLQQYFDETAQTEVQTIGGEYLMPSSDL